MRELEYKVPEALRAYVQNIMVMESSDPDGHTNIPFYADGYPGIMHQQSQSGCYLFPRNKKLSELFLYGQTIEPISLNIKGPFKFIVFQLYPFASKYLLGINPKELNDDCFDLLQIKNVDSNSYVRQLRTMPSVDTWVAPLCKLMQDLIAYHKVPTDDQIQKAISLILQQKGQLRIAEVREQVYLTERTLERKFIDQVGLTPKQFAKIIQFKSSMKQLSEDTYGQLLDVGLDSGFADQSHFIRSFKKYTGQTPRDFLKQATA